MDLLKRVLAILPLLSCTGCFYLKSAYHQVSLLNQRVPIEEAMRDPSLTEDDKRKLRLSQDVRLFSQENLGLKSNGNYSSFVKLNRDSVTYVVSAAPKWELKHYLWSFPFVGKVPYKGFFVEDDAKEEEKGLKEEGLDTYLRGVSAYSTLGWFKDPLLSSMLRYKDTDLVNTLIHETVHATLYIKSNADFNERLAVFMGNWGTEIFYKQKEGADSKTLEKIRLENNDEKIFAAFISKEIEMLGHWYESATDKQEEIRQARLKEIQQRFETEVKPRLKSKSFEQFPKLQLNNARLLIYKTYLQDLSVFEKLAEKLGWDYRAFLEKVKTLEKADDPKKAFNEMTDA